MAQVPDNNVPTVAPRTEVPDDYQRLQTNPAQFGGAIAKGVQQLGQGASDAAQFWGRVQVDGQLNDAQRDTQGVVDEFKKLKGADALNQQDDFNKRIDSIIAQNRSSLGTPAQQLEFDNGMRPFRERFLAGQITSHAASEGLAHISQVNQSTVDNSWSMLPAAADKPDVAQALIGDATNAAVKQVHAQYGVDADPQIEMAEMIRVRAEGYKRWIAAVAANDPARAAEMTETFKRQLAADYPQVAERLQGVVKKQQFEVAGAALLGQPPPQGAFDYRERSAGLPSGYAARTIQLESGGNPDAVAGSHYGLGQFSPAAARRYGVSDPGDVGQVSNALLAEASNNTPSLAKTLGRTPNASELYVAHQQGLAGASALLGNPNQPAWESVRSFYGSDAVAQQAIWGNMTPSMRAQFPGGVAEVTGSQFVKLWSQRYSGASAAAPIIDKQDAYRRLDGLYGNDPTMWRGVKSVIDREYSLQETENAQRRGELQAQIPGLLADVRDGNTEKPLPPDVALLGSVAAGRVQTEYDSAYREGQARRSMLFASPDEIGGLRDSLARGPGSDDMRRQDLAAFDRAVDERNKLIVGTNGKGGDPAAYVQAYPGVAVLRAKLDPKNPATYDAYATASLALQDHLGVPPADRHILAKGEAEQIAGAISAPGADAKAILDQTASRYGNHYQQVFRDLVTDGKLSPSYQLVGALDPKNAGVLSRWLQGVNDKGEIKTADEILGQAGSKSTAATIRENIRSNPALTDLQHSWADSGFSPEQIKGLSKSVEDLAYAKTLYERADPSAAATAAVDAVAGKYTLWSGQGSARVPIEVNATVRANAAKTLADLKEDGIAVPGVIGADRQSGSAHASDYLRLLKASPYWVTSPDGKGLMLKDSYLTGSLGRIVTDKAGKPISVPFDAPLMQDTPTAEAAAAVPAMNMAMP